jgi:DNA-binding transcriptional LysR family regulator
MESVRSTLAFVTAAKEGSFTQAARTLDLSPQAVAASIARLEQTLGVRLFNRTTRSIALTEEGQRFLAHAEVGLAMLNDALQSVRDGESAPSGLVRITTGAAFARRYLLTLLPAFNREFPEVRLDINFDDRRADLVRDGYDVAIRGGAIADSSLVTRRVCALHTICVASPAYLRRFGVPRSPDELAQHRIIGLRFASGRAATWDFRVRGKSVQFQPSQPVLTLSDTEAVGDAAAGGIGIARVAMHFAWRHLVSGELKVVLNHCNDAGNREMVLHYPHREFIAPRIRAFVDFMLAALKQEPSLQAPLQSLAQYEA